jgi:hypothetical protein
MKRIPRITLIRGIFFLIHILNYNVYTFFQKEQAIARRSIKMLRLRTNDAKYEPSPGMARLVYLMIKFRSSEVIS